MADIEQRVDKLEEKHIQLSANVEAFIAKIDMYIQNNDKTIAELKESNKRIETRVDRMESKMDTISNEVRNIGRYVNALVVTTIIGVATMVWSMVTFLGSIKQP